VGSFTVDGGRFGLDGKWKVAPDLLAEPHVVIGITRFQKQVEVSPIYSHIFQQVIFEKGVAIEGDRLMLWRNAALIPKSPKK
jgi:hypothetical protein